MKPKTAWLITWEGSEADFSGRCKVVTILPAGYGDDNVTTLLRVLYHTECNLTLDGKMLPTRSRHRDNYFKRAYRDINSEYCYGEFPKRYLRARKVKNLRCEESKKDDLESTVCWTELPKYRPNPKYGELGSPGAPDALLEVHGEIDQEYTYSARASVEAERVRKAELARLRRDFQ